jgi:site-specific recombinase XerD
MPTTVRKAVEMYLQARDPAHGTRRAYRTTVKKWLAFDGQVSLEKLDRPTLRKFLSWVYEQASTSGGTNPGRTANKARTHLRAVVSWAWENDLIETPPRFPQPLPARDVAGRHYLTKKLSRVAPFKKSGYGSSFGLPSKVGGTVACSRNESIPAI